MTQEIKTTRYILGLFFITVGLNWFLLPHDIASAGVGAIGHLVETAFSIQRSVTVWSINLMMLLLACPIRKISIFKTVAGSLLFPVVLEIVPKVEMISSHFFSLISGSLLFSLGVYTLYTVGASNGGITIPPIIFHKFFGFQCRKDFTYQ